MEDFEGISSIVDEFNIKGSTLNLFDIKWKTSNSDKELKKFVQIPYGPHNKAFPSLPVVVNYNGSLLNYTNQDDSENKSILEYDESKFDSDFELNESSASTNLTQFMNEYNINDEPKERVDNYKPDNSEKSYRNLSNIFPDTILESNYEEMLEKNSIISSDFIQLSSNHWENIPSKKLKLSPEKEELIFLKSEPFADLESDGFEGLRD